MSRPNGTSCRVVSAIPGRVRMAVAGRADDNWWRGLSARLATIDGVCDARAVPDATSVVVSYDAKSRPVAQMVEEIDAAVREMLPGPDAAARRHRPAPPGGRAEPSRQGTNRRKGERPAFSLLAPTAALALALLEAPATIVVAALAVASVKPMRKAARAAREGRIAMSQLDMVTVSTLAMMGDFTSAAEIAWLLGVVDYLHSAGLSRLRGRVADMAPIADLNAEDREALARMIQQAPIGSTRTEQAVQRLADKLAAPLLGLTGILWGVTRDPLRAINVLKFAGMDSGVGLAAPTSVLSAMLQGAREGVFVRGGQSFERLARVNAVALAHHGRDTAELERAVEGLLARQVLRIAVPPGPALEVAQHAADRAGQPGAVVPLSGGGASAVRRMRADGLRVAAVIDGSRPGELGQATGFSISVRHTPGIGRDRSDVILLHGDLGRLPEAIDLARETMRVLQQNAGIVIGASSTGFAAAIAGLSNPVLTSVVSNGSTVAAGLNGLRPVARDGAHHTIPQGAEKV